jgi:hypothetical protein
MSILQKSDVYTLNQIYELALLGIPIYKTGRRKHSKSVFFDEYPKDSKWQVNVTVREFREDRPIRLTIQKHIKK